MAGRFIIPIDPTEPVPADSLELNGVRFILRFFFMRRTGSWYMHVDAADGTRLVSGHRITSYYPLINDPSNPLLPDGLLLVTDPEQADPDGPGEDDFGVRYQMLFVNRQDVADLANELLAA